MSEIIESLSIIHKIRTAKDRILILFKIYSANLCDSNGILNVNK